MKIGHGFDCHRLVPGRDLVLGGVRIPYCRGLEGHSDGDVLIHAVADAILGALAEGDLGRHFPSDDEMMADISGREIASTVAKRVAEMGFKIGNIDATVIAQEPRLAPYQERMTVSLSDLFSVPEAFVNLKVTSTDFLGAIGRGEGVAAEAVVLVEHRESRR